MGRATLLTSLVVGYYSKGDFSFQCVPITLYHLKVRSQDAMGKTSFDISYLPPQVAHTQLYCVEIY